MLLGVMSWTVSRHYLAKYIFELSWHIEDATDGASIHVALADSAAKDRAA